MAGFDAGCMQLCHLATGTLEGLEGTRQKQGSDLPALHSGLKQDHVLKGLPAFCRPDLVGLEGGCEGRLEPDQLIACQASRAQAVNPSCRYTWCCGKIVKSSAAALQRLTWFICNFA